jgi:hypothetical protein
MSEEHINMQSDSKVEFVRVNFPAFSYIKVNEEKLNYFEYNGELTDKWPLNQMFSLENSLLSDGRAEDFRTNKLIDNSTNDYEKWIEKDLKIQRKYINPKDINENIIMMAILGIGGFIKEKNKCKITYYN